MKNFLQSYVNEFKTYLLLEKGLSKNSIDAYSRDIDLFFSFLEEQNINKNSTIKSEHIRSFLEEVTKKGLAAVSQARYLSSIKAFFKFLQLLDVLETSPLEFIKMPKISKKLPHVLSLEEINTILQAISQDTIYGVRNKLIIEILYACGLRVSELIQLRVSQIDFSDDILRIMGKGKKERLVPIPKRLTEEVRFFLQKRDFGEVPQKYRDCIFLGKQKRPLTRNMVFIICKQAGRVAEIKKQVSPHTFRHCYATHMIENGADLRIIQELLGHSSISTTEIYTHLDKRHVQEIFFRYHPINSS